MTRKDYKLLAGMLLNYRLDARLEALTNEVWLDGYAYAIEAVAAALKLDNPKFDEERFVDAVVEGKGL